jgi:predicted AAA+ superfamily ATPase
MIERSHIEQLKKRLDEPRNFIQVIIGPRQVGKTTMILQFLKKYSRGFVYESADTIMNSNRVWLQQVWETARLKKSASGADEFLLVIDEVQKVENWSELVKQQWDKDTREGKNLKVVLLGSSRLLIQKGLSESLAGRFETLPMNHWSFSEMEAAFEWTIEQYIYFGGYPGSALLLDDEDRWKNYIKDALIETSISKDILMLTRVDKPALLKRLFEIGSLYSGQILSYTKLMGELQDAGNTTTLAHYLNLLSDSGLLGGLEKYAGNVIRQRSSSPKFQVYNNALLSAQVNRKFSDVVVNPKEWGRLVESSVGAHLLNHSISERYQISYWRESNSEVDFVLEKNGKVIAIEVKSGRRAANLGMNVFAQKFHPDRILLVGTGGFGIEDFLRINPITLF